MDVWTPYISRPPGLTKACSWMSGLLGIVGVLGVLGEKKRRPDIRVPGLQRFFVAWEADALPTELFPLKDLRLVDPLQVSTWVSIPNAVNRFHDSRQGLPRESGNRLSGTHRFDDGQRRRQPADCRRRRHRELGSHRFGVATDSPSLAACEHRRDAARRRASQSDSNRQMIVKALEFFPGRSSKDNFFSQPLDRRRR